MKYTHLLILVISLLVVSNSFDTEDIQDLYYEYDLVPPQTKIPPITLGFCYTRDGYFIQETNMEEIDNPQSGQPGYIANCEMYIEDGEVLQCIKCDDGYVVNPYDLFTGSTNACIEIDANCGDYLAIGPGAFICLYCADGMYENQASECVTQPVDGETNYVANCDSSYYSTLGSDNRCFDCQDANDGEKQHWDASPSACVPITTVVENCEIYGEVGCSICADGYWKSMPGNCFTKTPADGEGVANCDLLSLHFTENYICVKCSRGYYPAANLFSCVQATNTVDNCDSYFNDGECQVCDDGYYVTWDYMCDECPFGGPTSYGDGEDGEDGDSDGGSGDGGGDGDGDGDGDEDGDGDGDGDGKTEGSGQILSISMAILTTGLLI